MKLYVAKQVVRHLENLHAIFGADPDWDTLQRLEARAHRLAERQCNESLTEEYINRTEQGILEDLDKELGFRAKGIIVFCNDDPRGYGLKVEDDAMKRLYDSGKTLHTDWGGYGIIAPEFE
jgi:hypothetical protein